MTTLSPILLRLPLDPFAAPGVFVGWGLKLMKQLLWNSGVFTSLDALTHGVNHQLTRDGVCEIVACQVLTYRPADATKQHYRAVALLHVTEDYWQAYYREYLDPSVLR